MFIPADQKPPANHRACSAVLFLLLAILLGVYLLSTIVAFSRAHPNRWLIAVINIAGGVTFFGWLPSLAWLLRRLPTAG
jgi:hypothetical protein